jgi:hypothetical protein
MRRAVVAGGLSLAVGAGLSFGQLALLRAGSIWRADSEYEFATAMLLWCGASAVIVGALAGDRVGGAHRAVVVGAAGLGVVPAMVVAVVTAPRPDLVDPVPDYPLTTTLYGWTAVLAVALGLAVAGILVGRRPLFAPSLVWHAWMSAVFLLSAEFWQPDRLIDDDRFLLVLLVSIVLLAGVVAAGVARSGASFATATAGGLIGPLLLTMVGFANQLYWYDWLTRDGPCMVASGECKSTYVWFEMIIAVGLAVLATAAAMAGAGIGSLLRSRTRPSTA